MSKIEVNTIEPQCGTTLTLGASGDTVTLASGASQSGFGRTGTVNWQTGSIKTGDFTAANGEGYFVDTNSGAVTATLPSSPSAGSIVAFKDYKSTFSTNALTIDRNSSKINGTTDNAIISASGSHISMVYVDATQGWLAINDNTTSIGDEFIVATGGTITTCGNFKTHTFTGPGTFTVSCLATSPANNAVEYVVVAGGGGGGGSDNSGSSGRESGGGGAGGFRSFTALSCASSKNAANGLTVTATAFPITIGAGGAGSIGGGCDPTRRGCSGSNSIFSTITSAGGGGGGSGFDNCTPARAGGDGGNGGGSGAEPIAGGGTIGSGNSPSTSPPQGENGGEGGHVPGNWAAGGGGGGAGAVGTDAANPGTPGIGQGGSGGVGGFVPSGFGTPSPLRFPGPVPGAHYFAGGGGGGSMYSSPTAGVGGSGGGGAGGSGPPGADRAPGSGTANSGGGGGGQGRSSPSNTSGSGGSGIVMIRYKFQ
jgi:hypothetical protein